MVRILMCGPIERSGGVSTHTKYITKYLEESGATVILYNQSPERALPNPFSVFVKLSRRTYLLLFQGIKRKKYYDILHTQVSGGIFSFISAVTGCLISKICNKKFVVTFHYRPSKRFINSYKSLFWYVLKHSDVFFVVSKKQKSLIKETFHNSLKEIFEKQIEKAYLEEYVKIIGQIKHNEIPVWINACDIFVLPSLNEGNP